MLIDWFTVGAQVLNFLILVWLMKHFLYQPVLNAIDAREKKIAAELADAAAKKTEAAKDRDDFQKKNEVFDQQRAALLSKATDEAKVERQRLLDDARKAADALSVKRQETLLNDAHHLNQAIARRTQQEVFSIARKALTDLATTSLEERISAVFTRRLREIDGQAKETMGTALRSTTEPAVVRSAFDLPAEERAKIQNAINETFSADAHLRFETAPDLVGGVELSANGQKMAWSIDDYLKSLEKGVGEIIKQQEPPAPKPAPKPAEKAEPKPDSKPEATAPAKSTPEVKAEPKPSTESAPKPETDAKAKPEKEAASKPETKAAAPQPNAKVAAEPDAKPEPKPDSTPKPGSATAVKSTPEIKTESEPGAESAPEPEEDAKSKLKGETEPEVGTKPDAEPTAQPKTEAVDGDPSTPKEKSELKPTAEPPPETKAAATAKTEAPAPVGS